MRDDRMISDSQVAEDQEEDYPRDGWTVLKKILEEWHTWLKTIEQ